MSEASNGAGDPGRQPRAENPNHGHSRLPRRASTDNQVLRAMIHGLVRAGEKRRAVSVLVRQMLERAGKMVGLGDYRPQCKGPFGKFHIVDWNLLQPQHIAAARA